ncbi:unnamed protein product [Caenorhabditis nigoni]
MILIFTSILCLLGGVDAYLTCASCSDIQDSLFPSGSSFPRVKLVFNHFIANDGCKMASFKCVVVENRCNTTAYISNPTTGERLVTYEQSQTESIGGNITCVASPESAGWQFNGVVPSINCNMKWSRQIGFDRFQSPPVEPTTPTTTTTTVKPTTSDKTYHCDCEL